MHSRASAAASGSRAWLGAQTPRAQLASELHWLPSVRVAEATQTPSKASQLCPSAQLFRSQRVPETQLGGCCVRSQMVPLSAAQAKAGRRQSGAPQPSTPRHTCAAGQAASSSVTPLQLLSRPSQASMLDAPAKGRGKTVASPSSQSAKVASPPPHQVKPSPSRSWPSSTSESQSLSRPSQRSVSGTQFSRSTASVLRQRPSWQL